jgi:site-specific DNA recombinase
MKAAIYARVSTDKQGRDQTIDSQLEALRRWATAHGHELKDDHVYIDEGYSGARLDRPALDRLRDAAREGEFDVLGVYSPDRLARRYAYQVLLLEELRKAACAVEFIERPISDDPHDQLLLQIQGAIAEYERAVLGERFRRGKLQKARAGHWIAGQAPYGYRYVPNRDGVPGHLEIEEVEAGVVRMLYRWLIEERMTVRQILKRLAAGPWRPRNGKRLWSNSVVHRVLSDPLYSGTAYANRHVLVAPRRPRSAGPRAGLPTCRKDRPREEWIPIPVPALVDAMTYRDASEQLARNSALSFRNNTRNDYLLRCLLTCRTCGLAMCGVTTSGARGRRQHRYYMCHGKDTLARDRAHPCPQRRPRAEELEAAVWDHVKGLLDDPSTLAAQFEERARQADAPDADAHAAGQKWEAQLRRLDREEQRLLDAYQAEAIDLDELKRRREQINSRKHLLSLQRDQEQRLRSERQTAKEVWADLTAFCERVRSRLDEATLAERQRILQLLIDRVIVGEDTLEIRHVIPLGRLKAEPASPCPTDPTGSGGGEGDEPEGTAPNGLGARLRTDGVEATDLMLDRAEDLGNGLRIQLRTVGGDAVEDQPAVSQDSPKPLEERPDILVSRVVVEDLVAEPFERAVVDDRQDTEGTVVQLVSGDIPGEAVEGPIKVGPPDSLGRLFPPWPPPNSGWWRRGRRPDGLARDANWRFDRACRPPRPAGRPKPRPAGCSGPWTRPGRTCRR